MYSDTMKRQRPPVGIAPDLSGCLHASPISQLVLHLWHINTHTYTHTWIHRGTFLTHTECPLSPCSEMNEFSTVLNHFNHFNGKRLIQGYHSVLPRSYNVYSIKHTQTQSQSPWWCKPLLNQSSAFNCLTNAHNACKLVLVKYNFAGCFSFHFILGRSKSMNLKLLRSSFTVSAVT